MCQERDLPLSLKKGDTFNGLCTDFDQILRSTLQGMEETEQDTAVINVQVKITLTQDSAPDLSVAGGQQTRAITKPRFDHSVSAVIQRKEKKTGSLAGEYELVWDRETCQYVARPIDNGQYNLFDKKPEGAMEGKVVDADYTVVEELPAGERPQLPPGPETPSDGDTEPEEGAGDGMQAGETTAMTDSAPFEWMRKFIGSELRVLESMGNYTVRTADNKIVLSSAASPDAVFFAPAEKLKPHVGHKIVCVAYGEPDLPVNISIECQDCNEVLFSIDAPAEEFDGQGDGDQPYEEGDPK